MLNNDILRNNLVSRRAFIIGLGKIGLFFSLSLKMFYMQLIQNKEYKTSADKNRILLLMIPPMRGNIYDTKGSIIAKNKPCFKLFLDKNLSKNYKQDINLAIDYLCLSEDIKQNIFKRIKNSNFKIPIVLLDDLSWQQISSIEEIKSRLSSLFIDKSYNRFYEHNRSLSHLIGYIGNINTEEKVNMDLTNVNDFNVGKSGIELYYENYLQGTFGYKQMEVNAYGKYVRELSYISSVRGNDLYLNVDATLQDKILSYLPEEGSSVVVMDVNTGGILILASTPTFEANNFTKLSQSYWHSLINDPHKPLLNKALQNAHPPGSIFKIITILAALKAGISSDHTVNCIGGASALGGKYFRCASKIGHGQLDMHRALKHSCNAYMYGIGKLIGADPILEMAHNFGLGRITGIDLPNENSGFLPSKAWKKKKLKTDWNLGDTLNLCIGQGFMLVTPLQIARLSAAIASDGKLFTPRVLRSVASFAEIDVNKEHLQIVKAAMYDTVNTPSGTAYASRILQNNQKLAGKTGTSQVQSKSNIRENLSSSTVAWKSRNHAVFMGFAPYYNPKYSIAVFVDHGGDGSRASAPVASKIMQEIFNQDS